MAGGVAMIFKHINVVIEPWHSNPKVTELRVTLATLAHGEYTKTELFDEDQLRSIFDRVWDYIGRDIKKDLMAKEK